MAAVAEVRPVGHRLLAGFRLKCRNCRVEFEFVNQPFGSVTADGLELLSEVRPIVSGIGMRNAAHVQTFGHLPYPMAD